MRVSDTKWILRRHLITRRTLPVRSLARQVWFTRHGVSCVGVTGSLLAASETLANFRGGILAFPLANGLEGIFVLDLGNGLDGIFLLAVGNLLEEIFAIICFLLIHLQA